MFVPRPAPRPPPGYTHTPSPTQAQLKKPAAPVEPIAPVDREEINHLRQRLDKAEDGLDAAAKRERDLKQLVTEVNGKLLDARDAFITLENAHVQQIDDLNAEIDRLLAEIARLTKVTMNPRNLFSTGPWLLLIIVSASSHPVPRCDPAAAAGRT